MSPTQRQLGQGHLPFWAASFVVFACVAIAAVSGWRELQSRAVELKNAEVDVMNLASSLTQHAEDTFELADTVLTGLVNRLEVDETSAASIAKIQAFLPSRKNGSRIRGIFIYGAVGQWLANSEQITNATLNNSDRDYFKQHRASPD